LAAAAAATAAAAAAVVAVAAAASAICPVSWPPLPSRSSLSLSLSPPPPPPPSRALLCAAQVGEAKSKQEEDRIIQIEIGVLKKLQADRANPLTGKRLKEFLVRLLYVEMLGHDASFGYMRAVELSASANLMEKRVSYLCAGLCFAPEHEFRMMLVNRLQRDLKSANVLECAIALSAAAKILTADMIPAVLPGVVELLKHDQELVRKKAVMLVHRFLVLQPESVAHLGDKFRRALCDKCPEVMGASLHIFYELSVSCGRRAHVAGAARGARRGWVRRPHRREHNPYCSAPPSTACSPPPPPPSPRPLPRQLQGRPGAVPRPREQLRVDPEADHGAPPPARL
jgi:hypothetical protein